MKTSFSFSLLYLIYRNRHLAQLTVNSCVLIKNMFNYPPLE